MKPGKVIMPDQSNGPKSLTWPKDCHCHCAIPVMNAWYESGLPQLGVTIEISKHKHPGKGGWWKNDDCLICKK